MSSVLLLQASDETLDKYARLELKDTFCSLIYECSRLGTLDIEYTKM